MQEVKWAWVLDPETTGYIHYCADEDRVDQEAECGIRTLDRWDSDGKTFLGNTPPPRAENRWRYWKMNDRDGLLWPYALYFTAYTHKDTQAVAATKEEWEQLREIQRKFNLSKGFPK